LDEWGRGLNILGCTLACQSRFEEAKTFFKESLEMLKVSGYKLFSWRSQLNYIHMSLMTGGNFDLLSKELDEAYKCFTSLHHEKLMLLIAQGEEKIKTSRDYHALLAFALYRSKINGNVDHTVAEDIDLGQFLKYFQDDLHMLLCSPKLALPNSTFYQKEMIMMVG